MYNHLALRLEANLATARRALYRAIAVSEEAQEFGFEEDLRALNEELGRVMSSVQTPRRAGRVAPD